ncbi:MAG: DotD/TraH family lipoprotein [Candidimonas sp.]|nr:DotD/TraH family lipoprotein [Candidimonas sp.]
MKKPFVVILATFLLAGCASKQSEPALVTATDPAVVALNESAMRVARSAEQAALAQSVSGRNGRVTEEYRIDLSRVPPELREPMLLEGGFHGELEVFLRSLTDAVGWAEPVILGNKPSTPLMVAFTEQRRPAVYWFADAGYQSSELAKVTINSSLKQVVLQYREAGGIR